MKPEPLKNFLSLTTPVTPAVVIPNVLPLSPELQAQVDAARAQLRALMSPPQQTLSDVAVLSRSRRESDVSVIDI